MTMTNTTINLSKGMQVKLTLAQGQVLASNRMDGLAIECTRGRVWVTFESEGFDHVLNPGERLALGMGGRVVIEALEPSEFAMFGKSTEALAGRDLQSEQCDRAGWMRKSLQALTAHRLSMEMPI
jgi:hypothetical protein